MPIYLIRHGQTYWNTEERMQGQLDSPLTVLGTSHAKNAGKFLRSHISGYHKLIVFSSPLGRALQTAKIVCAELGFYSSAVIQDPKLMEANHGVWSGLTKADVKRKFPKEFHERKYNHWHFRFPEGGSLMLTYPKGLKNGVVKCLTQASPL